MKKYLLILFLYPALAHSQIITDTVIYVTPENDTVRVVTYHNAATAAFVPKVDTAAIIATKYKLDSTAAALAASVAATYATITTVNGKQATLVSATNIKTVNGSTILGSGDLVVSGGAVAWDDVTGKPTTTSWLSNSTNKNFVTDAQSTVIGNTSGTNTGDNATNTQYSGLAASKQDALVSGTNIKTINGTTILGSGNVTITSTADIGTSPTASSTTTITHNLGRVPTIIRIYGYGIFTANAASTATTSSMGTFNSSGNRCVYQRYGAAITTTQAGLTSNTFCILLATGGGSFISGVIQNVTSTQFDIVWTETGTATAQPYLWEAQ